MPDSECAQNIDFDCVLTEQLARIPDEWFLPLVNEPAGPVLMLLALRMWFRLKSGAKPDLLIGGPRGNFSVADGRLALGAVRQLLVMRAMENNGEIHVKAWPESLQACANWDFQILTTEAGRLRYEELEAKERGSR